MTNPFLPVNNDVSVKFISPSSPTDPRTVLAEEFSLNSELAINLFKANRSSGWQIEPKITVTNSNTRKIKITGTSILKTYPEPVTLNHEIIVPSLSDTTSLINREDNISLIGLIAEVGEEQDSLLGTVSFKYQDTLTNTITEIAKENARRYRSFWLLVLHTGNVTADIIWNLLTSSLNGKKINITNTNETGFPLSNIRLYAVDNNWEIANYTVLPNSIEILPVGFIARLQNYKEDGYIYGYNGEEPLSSLFIGNLSKINTENTDRIIYSRILEIAKGIPGKGSITRRSIKNLIPGEYGGNIGKPGAASDSPNGSICISNDQRVTFTNQAFKQKYYVLVLTASTGTNNRATGGVTINTNSPTGTRFSPQKEDHKIYSISGQEQSGTGTFYNIGGTNYLSWSAGDNSIINPGDKILFVPAIEFPSGSGLSLAFSKIERAWINGSEIHPNNIRDGYSDLNAYEDPANNGDFIIVYGSERGAIHYIYKRISVTANNQGIAIVPTNSNPHQGCFAFVQGITGRIDSPVVSGITPGQERKALVYYPPKYNETWQFQMLSCEYQGVINQHQDFLNGATIITYPKCYIHTSGGGLSVHRGDIELSKSLIATQMPRVPNPPIKPYTFDGAIHFPSEQYPGPISWREDIPIWASPGFAFPAPGQKLTIVDREEPNLPYALNGKLYSNNTQIAVKIPAIASRTAFQAIICFLASKEDNVKLVVATQNIQPINAHDMVFDIDQHTAIDIFNI